MFFSGFDLLSLLIIEAWALLALLVCIMEYMRAGSLRNVEPIFYLGILGISFQSRLGFLVTGILFEYPFLIVGIGFTAAMLGPVLILILRGLTEGEFGGKLSIGWHIYPWLGIFAVLLVIFIADPYAAVDLVRRAMQNLEFNYPTVVNIAITLTILAYLGYFLWSFISFQKKHDLNLLKALRSPKQIKTMLLVGIAAIVLVLVWLITKDMIYLNIGGWFITTILFSALIYQMKYPNFFSSMIGDLRTQKYERTHLKGVDVSKTLAELERILGEEKAFTDGELRMPDLARELSVTNHQLSRMINEGYGKSFYELLNTYRVEEVKKLLVETDASVIEILYQVGFNSKSSFNNQFSKLTGTTPTKFRRKMKKKAAGL